MNKDKQTRKYFSLSVSQNMANEIDKCASNMSMNRNAFINMAIRIYLDNIKINSNFDDMKKYMYKKIDEQFKDINIASKKAKVK